MDLPGLLAKLEQHAPLIGAIVGLVGLVGTLMTAIATWAKDLNSQGRRIRTLDEATKRVSFWDTWSKALAAADSGQNQAILGSKVKTEVLAAAGSVEKAFHALALEQASEAQAHQKQEQDRGSVNRLRRWFLLYKPARRWAWVPRCFFYIYVIEAPLVPFLPEPQDLPSRVFMSFSVILAAIFFRWLSIRVEKVRRPTGAA